MLRQRYVWLLFTALMLVYVGLSVGMPPDQKTLQLYHLSETALRLLSLTVAAPIVAISFVALFGYSYLQRYAKAIRNASEGAGFLNVSHGLGLLAFSLPVASIFSQYSNYLSQHHSAFVPTSVILSNYVSLAITIVAFVFIGIGARAVYQYIKKPAHITSIHWVALSVLVLSVVYSFLIIKSPYRQQPLPSTGKAIFYLPDWLILLTIILPNVLTWYIGAMSGFYIYLFSKHVKGVLYKQSMRYVAIGLEGIIGAFMLIRYIAVFTASLTHLSLSVLLLVIYFLLITISVGFILVALGAKRLQKIEEV